MNGPIGDIDPDDHGTQPGKPHRPIHHAPVTNQPILALDGSVGDCLDPKTQRQLAVIQVTFARDVSQLAADAYEEVLRLLTGER